jgi:hypothetical protein
LLWLKRDIPQDDLVAPLISPAIGHVDVGTEVKLRDKLALVHWMALMMREARNTAGGKGPPNLPAGMWMACPAGVSGRAGLRVCLCEN